MRDRTNFPSSMDHTAALPANVRGKSPVRVSRPEDPREKEADHLSYKVMAGESVAGRIGKAGGGDVGIQRMCRSCGDDDRRKRGETKADGPSAAALQGSLSGGQPLPSAQRGYFESRLGRDFGDVRVHTGAGAENMAHSLNANAFTYRRNIAFAPGRYRPGTSEGRRLLAHELMHVVQQDDGPALVQRELATPRPAPAPAAQPELTADQIQAAIRFNSRRFNALHTGEIQDIVGTAQTGTWNEDDIRALARIQEEYGLVKDGQLGWEAYQWLIGEIRNERLKRTDENCPVAFWIDLEAQNIVPRNNGAAMTRTFRMNADLPGYCDCADYEYRQFIRGHFTLTRGATVHDMGTWFNALPAGRLFADFREDGDTGAAAVNYGHRDQPAEVINRYLNNAGAVDQADGCRFRGSDTPGGNFTNFNSAAGVNVAAATGDTLDILVQFRGEVQRNGTVVRSNNWTAIQSRFALPA